MKQSRLASFLESCGNTLSGFLLGLGAQWLFLPLLGVAIDLQQNIIFALIMTAISIARSFGWRRLMEALHVRTPLSPAMLAIAAERRRQIEAEGWSHEYDDLHAPGDLELAAAAYLSAGSRLQSLGKAIWPWSAAWFKPSRDHRRNLVRGAALAVAALERHDRSRRVPRRFASGGLVHPTERGAWTSGLVSPSEAKK